MAEVKFTYEGQDIVLSCNKNQKMKDICSNLGNKINVGINSLVFLSQLNLEKTFEEITKENRINVIVYKNENEEIYSKCGRTLNNELINEILLSNKNMNSSLSGIKEQIELIINNNMDINYIKSQLKNINIVLNNINVDIQKINNKLNVIKSNNINKKEETPKNEITCIFNKLKDEINLLHDYTENHDWNKELNELYIEGKNNILDEKNIDIYINDKKVKFNYKYKSNEKGDIRVKFLFHKLLTSTNSMFKYCRSLKSIDLSSFDTTNVNNMCGMFRECSSLQSIDLSSFNTTNVKSMNEMFCGCSSLQSIDLSSFNIINVNSMNSMFCQCSSLQSIDLSSFNTINVNSMSSMFYGCSSLQSLDLSSFDTTNVKYMNSMFSFCFSLQSVDLSSFNTINVNSMSYMFQFCRSLKSIDLSSFNTTSVNNMYQMFNGCSSLKKENVKINNYGKKILNEIK